MFRVLGNKHYDQHRTDQKLVRGRTQFFKIVGFAGNRFLLEFLWRNKIATEKQNKGILRGQSKLRFFIVWKRLLFLF